MPRHNVKPVDVDQLKDSGTDDGMKFLVYGERELISRWPAAAMRGDCAREFADLYFSPQARTPWAGLISVRGATVVQDGLVFYEDRVLCGESLMYPLVVFPYPHSPLKFTNIGESQFSVETPDDSIHLHGVTALMACDGWQIYGHWLVDVLPRLHRVLASGHHVDTFLFAAPLRGWQEAMLKAVGLDLSRCRFVDLSVTTVKCEELLIPTYDRFNSEIRLEAVHIHEELAAQFGGSAEPSRMLFVARVEGSSRRMTNRNEVYALVESMGFETVYPETLPFTAQIELFASARMILGECGSGMHNALYSRSGARIAVLQSPKNLNFLQSQLCMLKRQEIFYALGEPEESDPNVFGVGLQDVNDIIDLMKSN